MAGCRVQTAAKRIVWLGAGRVVVKFPSLKSQAPRLRGGDRRPLRWVGQGIDDL
jgi:hypothetical protein